MKEHFFKKILPTLQHFLGAIVKDKKTNNNNIKFKYWTGGIINNRLVSLVGKVPIYRARGLGSIPSRTNTHGLKTIEEKVLLFL